MPRSAPQPSLRFNRVDGCRQPGDGCAGVGAVTSGRSSPLSVVGWLTGAFILGGALLWMVLAVLLAVAAVSDAERLGSPVPVAFAVVPIVAGVGTAFVV